LFQPDRPFACAPIARSPYIDIDILDFTEEINDLARAILILPGPGIVPDGSISAVVVPDSAPEPVMVAENDIPISVFPVVLPVAPFTIVPDKSICASVFPIKDPRPDIVPAGNT